MTSGVKVGPFQDQRPWFNVFVTGHPKCVPLGPWAYTPTGRRALTHPGAVEVRTYLDGVLWQRREAHRVLVWVRGARSLLAGIDETVRCYCEVRGISCLPLAPEPDTWSDAAGFRRDLEAVCKSHAVVWFGPRHERDPVTLAALLGIPYRVVRLPDLGRDPEREF